MRHSADYIITLPDGNISLLFNTWAFKKYSEKMNIELDGLLQGIIVNRRDLPDLLLIASEAFNKFNSLPHTHTDLDACEWIDALGGFNSEKIMEIWEVAFARLYNVDKSQIKAAFEKVVNDTEDVKKKMTESLSPGETSISSPHVAA